YARFDEAYVVLFIDWLLALSVQYICGLIPVRAEGSSDDTDRLSFIYPFASAVVALMLYFPVKSYVGSYVLSNECMAVLFGVYTLLSVLPLIIKKIRHFSSPYALMWIPALLYAVSGCTPEQKIIPAAALFIWYAVRFVRLNSAELEKNGIIYTSYPDFLTMVGMAVISLTVKTSTPMWEAAGISALFIITAYMGNFGSGRVNRNARKAAPYYTVLSVFFVFMPILSYIRRLDPANIVIDNDNAKLAVQIFAPVYLVFAVLSLLPFRYFERASLDRDAHKALRTAYHIGFGVLCAISMVFPAIGVPACYAAYFVLSKLIPQSRGTKENADTISDDTSSILRFADAVSVVYMCIMTLNYYFNSGTVYEMALVCLFALVTAAFSEKSIRKYFLPAASLFVFFPLNTLTGMTHTPDIAAAVIAGYGVVAFITQRMKKQPADFTAVLPLTILFAVFIRLLDLSHGISLPLAVISLSLMANSLRYRDNSRSRMLCCTAAAVFGLSVIDHISVISAGYSSVIPCISESIPYFEDIALAAIWLIMTVLIYIHAYRHVDMSGTELRGAAVIASAAAVYIPLLCITLRYEADIFLPAAAVTAVFGLLSAAGGRIKKCPVDFIWLQPVNIIICACIQYSCNGRDASLILLISAVCLLINSVVNTDHRWSIALCISDAAVFIGACFNYHNMDRAGSFPAKLVCITDRIPCFADVVFVAVWLIMAVVVFIHAHRYSGRDRAGLRAAAVTAAVSVGYIPIIAIADRYDADMMIVASAAALLFGILPVITKKLRNSPVDLIPIIPVTVAAGIFTTMYCYPCDATLVMGVTAVSLLINAVSYRNREWSLILSLCGTVLFLNDCACYPTAVEIIKGLRESRSITDGIPFLADVVSISVWLIMTILFFLHAYRHREEKGIIRRGVSLILSAAAVFLPLYLVAQAHDMAFAVPLTIFVGIMCSFGTANSLIPKEQRAAPEQLTRLILPALMFMTFVAMFPHKPLIACCIMLASAMVRGYQSIKQDREAGVYTLYTAVTLFMYCLAVTICGPLQNFAGSLREPVNIIITAVSAVICFIPFLITKNAAGRASGRFSYISFALFSGLMFFTVADISGRWVHISDTVPIDIVPVISTLESAFIIAVTAAYVLLVFACAVSLMKKNTVMLFPLLFWQYACMAVAMMRTGTNSILMLVPVAVFALFGRIWWNKALILPHGRKLPEKLPVYSDAFTLTAFIGALSVASFTNAGTTHKTVLWCTLTAFCILFALCRRKENHRYVNRVVLTLSSLMIPVVVWQQPFFTIPELFRTEIYMLSLVPALVSLYFIYREQRKIIDGFSFVTAVICLLILFFDAASTEYPADAVMLGFVIMCILALSFAFRQKRWFVLAVVSAVSEALLMTIRLWNSRTWWIYLLVVGVILLSIGISNEYEKKMAARGKKTAFSRFSETLSEWKW
ncbi:MAG: hypothetical protein II936_05980, partial [Oscillospiraceae bacterium]|nr:hypothetical protein [Oscillospiraceae bacterium]